MLPAGLPYSFQPEISYKVATDSGTGVDTQVAIDLSVSDSGTSVETIIERQFELPDDGTGVETSQIGITLTDEGFGDDLFIDIIEFIDITASDNGVGTETVVDSAAEPPVVSDAGTGLDTVGHRATDASDTGTGLDTGYVGLTVVDSGSGLDTVFDTTTVLPTVVDSGIGSDQASAVTAASPTVARLQYRVVIADLNGVELEEVPHKNLQVTYILNGPGSVTFTLPLRHPKSVKTTLDPGKREVHVYRGSDLIWGGYLWTVGVSSNDPNIRIAGEGYLSRLRRRLISDDLEYDDIEQFNIAWNLIAYTQAKSGGDLGITRDPGESPSGIKRTRRFHAWERTNIGEFLEDLGAVKQGFDFEITPDKVWKVYYPLKGVDTGTVIELGKNIEGIAYDVDASDTVSSVTAIGSGEGRWTCIATASDATALADFGLLEDVVSYSDIKHYNTLLNKAEHELELRKGQRIQPEVSVLVEDPPFDAYEVGDEIQVKAKLGYIDLNQNFRAISKVVQLSDAGRESVQVFFDEARV